MTKRKKGYEVITEWNCGVIRTTMKDGVVVAEPKFIYKIDQSDKIVHWATVDEIYKYNIKPLVKTMDEWDDTFTGLCWNFYLCFFSPMMTPSKNPNPLPLNEDGTIPEVEDDTKGN